MEMALVRLDDKGRVVIPKRLRAKVGISKREAVFAYAFDGLLFFRKADTDKASVLESIGKFREKGP